MSMDWKNPDYLAITAERIERLRRIRANPAALPALRRFYADHPARFIDDFGVTYDPRNPERGLPATTPFRLMTKQFELIEWFLARWHQQEHGLVEKSRDVGASWVVMAFCATMCLFHRGLTFGVGSRKEDLIDRSGDPSSLFFKLRAFLQALPAEFLGTWTLPKCSAHMRITFPDTGSAIIGEAGDDIGRGGRTSAYFVDEAAFLERPALIDASLSATSNCRIDLSSVNGVGNSFAQKRFSGKIPVFTFHWRDDPRKGEEWYAKQVATLDPVTVASEIDLSYHASVEGQLIPSNWVQAAIGAHLKLEIQPTGLKRGALDIADEGKDLCAFAGRNGILLEALESWSGKGGDIYQSVLRAFHLCDGLGYADLRYDADGLGAGVRGDARRINEDRNSSGRRIITDEPFRGSQAVWNPEGQMVAMRKNKDFFANLKAQAWWALRLRFQATYRAVVERMTVPPDDIIAINPKLPELNALTMELSQPTYSINSVGKIVIDKAPDGARSPNLADATMIAFEPRAKRRVWTERDLTALRTQLYQR
jgi:hypothetical protein